MKPFCQDDARFYNLVERIQLEDRKLAAFFRLAPSLGENISSTVHGYPKRVRYESNIIPVRVAAAISGSSDGAGANKRIFSRSSLARPIPQALRPELLVRSLKALYTRIDDIPQQFVTHIEVILVSTFAVRECGMTN